MEANKAFLLSSNVAEVESIFRQKSTSSLVQDLKARKTVTTGCFSNHELMGAQGFVIGQTFQKQEI